MSAAQVGFLSRLMTDPDGVGDLWNIEVTQDNRGRTVLEEGRKWAMGGRIEEGFATEFTSSATYVATVAILGETGTIA